ncbi:hypothetical protein [Desulfosarcina ovata]|uniref:hypothetical protein n=1 Tax=Desulfosarcina ovata TaxID=83564 RepID=UPI001564A236|nr:hypothetical protein [Desulfosarcina ovata]
MVVNAWKRRASRLSSLDIGKYLSRSKQRPRASVDVFLIFLRRIPAEQPLKMANPKQRGLRLAERNNSIILLVFVPVYRVAATGTYSRYAPVAAPCRRTQIRRDLGELFLSASPSDGV